MSNFTFLKSEWPDIHEAALKAEEQVYPDPRASCFYARRGLELAIYWLYKHDKHLRLPYQDHLAALLHEPTFQQTVGQAIFNKAKILKDLGNQAVHSRRPIRQFDAATAVKELFHVCFWLTRTYARGPKPADGLAFDPHLLPKTSPVSPQTIAQLQALETKLAERDASLSALLSDKAALNEELTKLRDEIAEIKAKNAATPDTHNYTEAETRDYFIDLLLKEAGWALDKPQDREFEVAGMPNTQEKGFVDYVLWGDDGLPLGLVEAKRTKKDAQVGQQKAKLYADCLEKQFGRRPLIFYSNGYEHWYWDDLRYPPRLVQGFLKKAELELAIQRRTTRLPLHEAQMDGTIVERFYQHRAIRRITESFEKNNERKALLVMVTGAGKTRAVVALCDVLMRCNWVKRVLFLADRNALVTQAVNAFKKFLPASSPVNLVSEKDKEGRVFVSTYPTMMGLIDEARDGERRFGVGHFDLVIIDEAHRSVFQKYRAIFDYFDSFLVGLSATPKQEVDRNTYRLFDLENGVPTDAYDLNEAVKDGFLVPAKAVSVPIRYQREGIRYDQLTDDEKDEWDALDWGEPGPAPASVDAAVVNKWLFNKDTVDKVLEHLMTRGQTVAGGDRLGKTIIFAKNHDHAKFIAERFDVNYPQHAGHFCRVIDYSIDYAQTLIDDFSRADKAPHIAVSVDMLDTGIDIHEVLNLVIFKQVWSKTKFWQMLGRGTHLCPDIFGPGQHKDFFYIFDYCGNLEVFAHNPPATEGAVADSLGKRLFNQRLKLIEELDKKVASGNASDQERELRSETAEGLRQVVAGMNLENFIVRPKRKLVEQYGKPESWGTLTAEQAHELAGSVAGLPSEVADEDTEAKRFDLLILRVQLAVLRAQPAFPRLRDQVKEIAALLEEKSSIPMVQEQMELIQEIQTDEFWTNVTAPMLERVRKRLRALVKLIEKASRKPLYTDFMDVMGAEAEVDLPGFGAGADFERFRAKARRFLQEHENHITIHKLRWNEPLTGLDLQELERMMVEAGIGGPDEMKRAKEESRGLGLFLRSLLGLDREAAKKAFAEFLAGNGKPASANQIEFINLIIEHLTHHGVMEPALLYESPFTDIKPKGPEGIFPAGRVEALVARLSEIRERAAA